MIYVAGKIRNYTNYDIPFLAAKKILNKQGLKHITAVEVLERINYTQLKENQIISEINNVIYDCDSICVLPNYKLSKGTMIEIELAKYYNKKIKYLEWNYIFDDKFINDFINFFDFDFNSRIEKNKSYKQILVSFLFDLMQSYTQVGFIIYSITSNAYSTVKNAKNNVNAIIQGWSGEEMKNEYIYKMELVEKFIRGYYEI